MARQHKCIGCFLELEKALEGDWESFPPDKRRWYEMINIENRVIMDYVSMHKPRRILEVGCGTGRVISTIETGTDYDEIIGIECDEEMHSYAQNRWINGDKIKIQKMFVKDSLPYEDNYFDFSINAMNIVGWQENESEWLDEMLRCSKAVFFSVYKRGYETERMEMYRTRGHKISEEAVYLNSNGQIVLGDCACMSAVVSKAYTDKEVENLCKNLSDKYDIAYEIDAKSSELLYLCFICKK
ncbi:MAG: class I SAM-dependent methyltransferase [archaeon]|nr:class I SAM-dependent methyltransferase [archaeon]